MLFRDLRYGIRVLLKSPGFTAIAILTLALGIGLNTALFSVVNAVLLQSLPYSNPERLMRVSEVHENRVRQNVSGPNLRDWRDRNHSFSQMAGFGEGPASIAGGAFPFRARLAIVTDGFFSVLGTQALVGRTFLPAEQQEGTKPVVVLNHAVWQSAFSADPAVLGKPVRIDGLAYTVVGVMPPGFDFPNKADVWIPRAVFPDRGTRSAHNYRVIGRLKPGVTIRAAFADLNAISAIVRQQDPSDRDVGASLAPLHESLVGKVRPAFLVLLGAVGFVLLIACVNVANLQLAKSGARARELALRTALGAKRSRLIRQLLTESLLLALLGGAAGLVLALWATDLLRSFVPPDIPLIAPIRVDATVLGFTALAAMLTGILFGLIPALSGSRTQVHDALKESSGRTTARRIGGILVITEIALAMVLLIGAGLLLKSFWRLQAVDPGFRTSHVLTAAISWPITRGPDQESGRDNQLYQRLFDRLRSQPGIEAVAATGSLPIEDRGSDGEFEIDGRPKNSRIILDSVYRVVTPGYFQALGIPLLRGRVFTERDDAAAPWAAVINQAMARQFFPNEDALGKRIRFFGFDRHPQWLTIEGIVADSRDYGLNAATPAICFTNYLQHPGEMQSSVLIVRAANEAVATQAIQTEIRAIDKNVPVAVRKITAVVSESLARQRFQMQLLLLFAVVALALAAIGIYGVLSYSVERRTAELGIRMALGAKPARILREILGEGLLLAACGLGFGIAAAIALTRTLGSFLFGVSPTDPLTFVTVALTLTAVALAASYIPARRATQVDPMAALRHE